MTITSPAMTVPAARPSVTSTSESNTRAGLGKSVAMITVGRFSGGTHGFVIGHITPEAQLCGPIALVRDGDQITIDAVGNTIYVDVSEAEFALRLKDWKAPPYK